MSEILAYVAAGMTAAWGVAHAVPTRQVVAGFEPISADRRRIVVQEWLAEAVAMIGIAALVVATVAVDAGSEVTAAVLRVGAGILGALAVLTALTGARTAVVWFRICPVVLTVAAVLLVVATLV